MDDDVDQLLGRRLQIVDLAAAGATGGAVVHRAGDVQDQGHLHIARGAVDLGSHRDGQGVVQQLAVGRKHDVGDQGLYPPLSGGDDDALVVHGDLNVAVLNRLELNPLQIGAKIDQGDALQLFRRRIGRPRGGQGGGVQGVLKLGLGRGYAVNVDAAQGQHDDDGQAESEDDRYIAAPVAAQPEGQGPKAAEDLMDRLWRQCRRFLTGARRPHEATMASCG